MTAEFDLEISDLEAARLVAKDHLLAIVNQALQEGGRVETEAATPEAGIDATLENPRSVVSAIVNEVLGRGTGTLTSVKARNLEVSSTEIG